MGVDATFDAGRFIVSTVFVLAALAKVGRWSSWHSELRRMFALPPWGILIVAVLVPALELVGAGMLVAPVTAPVGAVILTSLLLAFTAVLIARIRRGEHDVGCACFGRSTQALDWSLPVRNVVVVAVLAPQIPWDGFATDASAPTAAGLAGAVIAAVFALVVLEYIRLHNRLTGETNV